MKLNLILVDMFSLGRNFYQYQNILIHTTDPWGCYSFLSESYRLTMLIMLFLRDCRLGRCLYSQVLRKAGDLWGGGNARPIVVIVKKSRRGVCVCGDVGGTGRVDWEEETIL